jgi:SLBB domain
MAKSRKSRIATLAIAFALFGRSAGAQSPPGKESLFESRAQLQTAVNDAERDHRTIEASLLRSRLEHGDFQEGDKILLAIEIPVLKEGENADARRLGREDTAVVRTGKMLHFSIVSSIPALSLEGVLRSELADTVTSYLSKYIRDPKVRAVPLLRVAVLGAVGHPGWYSTRTDAVLADLIMQAGGVNSESDVSKTLIRRAGEPIWSTDQVRLALADGLSLDQLHLRAGDEVFIERKRQWSVTSSVQLLAAVTAVFLAVRAFHQPHN